MGNSLYEARIRKGYSQQTLADLSGVALGTVSRMERGARLRRRAFEQICKALEIDPEAVHDIPLYDGVQAMAAWRRSRTTI